MGGSSWSWVQRLLQKLHSILSALSTESFIRCCRLYRQRASFDSVGFIDGELHSIFCVAFILFSVLFRDLICFIRRLHIRLNTRVWVHLCMCGHIISCVYVSDSASSSFAFFTYWTGCLICLVNPLRAYVQVDVCKCVCVCVCVCQLLLTLTS